MNIKEAFRYQNALSGWISSVNSMFLKNSNIMTCCQTHNKSLAFEGGDIQVIDDTFADSREFECSVDDVVLFANSLICDKSNLCKAIHSAKECCGIDIDSLIIVNQAKQQFAQTYKALGQAKERVSINRKTDYRFNAEGNQISYTYPVEEKISPNYSPEKMTEIAMSLLSESDLSSSCIDRALINTNVKFDPPYDVNDTVSRALSKFLTRIHQESIPS